MKPLRTCFIPLLLLMGILVIGGCQSGQKRSQVLIEDVDQGTLDVASSFRQVFHLYPSPAEMLSVIEMAEVSYDESLMNSTDKVDSYLDSKAKSINLGVYMADLAYAALFGRHEAALDLLETSKTLAEEININDAVDESMIQKARENVEYLDSLYEISNDAFMNILSYCERNERSNTVVMVSAGAIVESLHFAVNMVDVYGTAEFLMQHLADQKYTFENFINFARGIQSDDPKVASTIADLERIKNIYDGINSGTGGVTIKAAGDSESKQAKKLVIGGASEGSQPSLTEEEFNQLKAAIEELRNKIVSGTL